MTQPDPPIFQRLDQTARFPYPPGFYLRRFLWMAVQALLIRPTPSRCRRWRTFWLRRFGADIQDTSGIRPTTYIWHPWQLKMGAYCCLSAGVTVYNLGEVTIGDHTVISQDVYLCAGSHDHTHPNLPLTRPPIHIGSGVWICAGAFIGPGVTIGDNAVVAARAVVVKDVPPGTIVAGNPARVVKDRPMRSSGE